MLFIGNLHAQTGTYSKTYKSGASCTIAVSRAGKDISADIFAWWHTASGQHGAFAGDGALQNNKVVLKGNGEGSDCNISLQFADKTIDVQFADCIFYNLPEDFNGKFHLLTNRVPGDYVINIPQAYFYKTADAKHRLRSFLIKGNKVTVALENIINKDWVFINYTNASGRTTNGYMPWSVLEFL
jgi:hypothetical protein